MSGKINLRTTINTFTYAVNQVRQLEFTIYMAISIQRSFQPHGKTWINQDWF